MPVVQLPDVHLFIISSSITVAALKKKIGLSTWPLCPLHTLMKIVVKDKALGPPRLEIVVEPKEGHAHCKALAPEILSQTAVKVNGD